VKSRKSVTSELISFFRECYSLMKVKGISEFSFEKGDVKISLKRTSPAVEAESPLLSAPVSSARGVSPPAAKARRLAPPEPEKKELNTIKSPLTGIFYNAPSPNSKPYIDPPCNVSGGETLCVVEAMKVMNEIESPSKCRIIRVLAKNAELVKKDEDLFEIE